MRLERCELPNQGKTGVYRKMWKEFVESGEDCMRVVLDETDKPLTTVYLGLREQRRKAVIEFGVDLTLRKVNDTIYLIRNRKMER